MTITAENVLFHIEIFGSQNIWACQMSIWFQSLLFYVTTSIKVKVLYEILYLPLQFPNCYEKSGILLGLHLAKCKLCCDFVD